MFDDTVTSVAQNDNDYCCKIQYDIAANAFGIHPPQTNSLKYATLLTMTELVGILNITPDSFSDGGEWNNHSDAIKRAEDLLIQGAAIIDIGAESTRPGASELHASEEWSRLQPVVTNLRHHGNQLSIDTYHPETVLKCTEILDDFIVNDVTGLHNPVMQEIVSWYGLRCIVSHLPTAVDGHIQTAHKKRTIDSEQQVVDELGQRIEMLEQQGIPKQNIIVDPGIGFGKTPELNSTLLAFAKHFPRHRTMIGYSRKKFLGEHRARLETNLAAGRIAINAGAAYLRVHDVAGHMPLLTNLHTQ